MMHIVQLANFYRGCSGGLRTVLDELGTRYVAAGHRVTRIVAAADDMVSERAGVQVISVRAPLVPGMGGYRMIVDVGRIDTMLTTVRPDVIELSDKTTLVRPARRAQQRGIPVVLWSHERIDAILAPRVPQRFPLERGADHWNRRLASSVDAIVCASDFAAKEFSRLGVRHIERVPLGVDVDTFKPDRSMADRPRTGRPTIVCVGRLSAEKRPRTAIAAARHLANLGTEVHLQMIGDGPDRQALEREAHGSSVSFTGHVHDRSHLAQILREADVAIAPCPFETFGLGALEALASGTPIVVPRAGALPELVTEGAGLAVADTPVAFALAIEQLLLGSRDDQRIAARCRAEEFEWDLTSSTIIDLFDRLTNRRGTVASTGTSGLPAGRRVLAELAR